MGIWFGVFALCVVIALVVYNVNDVIRTIRRTSPEAPKSLRWCGIGIAGIGVCYCAVAVMILLRFAGII